MAQQCVPFSPHTPNNKIAAPRIAKRSRGPRPSFRYDLDKRIGDREDAHVGLD